MQSMGYDISGSPTISDETAAAVSTVESLMQTWDRVEAARSQDTPPVAAKKQE
jgi:hypothetical protein